jgi:hypothetical protein
MISWSCCFRPVVAHHGKSKWGEGVSKLLSQEMRERERKRQRERERETRVPLFSLRACL